MPATIIVLNNFGAISFCRNCRRSLGFAVNDSTARSGVCEMIIGKTISSIVIAAIAIIVVVFVFNSIQQNQQAAQQQTQQAQYQQQQLLAQAIAAKHARCDQMYTQVTQDQASWFKRNLDSAQLSQEVDNYNSLCAGAAYSQP
jgi:uncharacterized PurR-regulated membrane protein YhhQ (DUF165 family)